MLRNRITRDIVAALHPASGSTSELHHAWHDVNSQQTSSLPLWLLQPVLYGEEFDVGSFAWNIPGDARYRLGRIRLALQVVQQPAAIWERKED